jgi:hypothetical protein
MDINEILKRTYGSGDSSFDVLIVKNGRARRRTGKQTEKIDRIPGRIRRAYHTQ